MKSLADLIPNKLTTIRLRTLLVICLFFVVSAFTVNLINVQFERSYTSDNTANQYVIQSLSDSKDGQGVFPVDSFFIHFPLYKLTDSLIHDNTRAKLFVQAYILGLAGLAGVVITLVYYLKKAKLYNKTSVVLSTLFLAFIFSTPIFAEYTLEVNHRLFEAGLALLLLIPAHEFLSSTRVRSTKILVGLAAAYAFALGTLWFDDPYFMYIMAGSITVTTLILWLKEKVTWKKGAVLAAVLLVGFIITKIYFRLFEHFNIQLLHNRDSTIIPVSKLFNNVQNTIGAYFANFHGNLFGVDLLNTNAKVLLPLLCGAALAGYSLVALGQSLQDGKNKLFVLRTLLAVTAVALVVFLTFTEIGSIPFTQDFNGRYLLFLPLLLAPLIVEYALQLFGAKNKKAGQLFTAVLAVGVVMLFVLNLYGTALGVTNRKSESGNSVNFGIISALEKAGYTKGYADYWQGPVNTYLSNNRIHFMQTSCSDGALTRYHWIVNDSDFLIKANKSFYVLDPTYTDSSTCSMQSLTKQYGNPTKVIQYQGRSILLYDRDILAY